MKLCIDCKYFRQTVKSFWSGFSHLCDYHGELINPVTGEDWKSSHYFCLAFRSYERYCGFNARFFEPKQL